MTEKREPPHCPTCGCGGPEFETVAKGDWDLLVKANESLREERDAAFKMSKCECGPDEACGNLVRAFADRDRLQAAIEEALEELADWEDVADAETDYGTVQRPNVAMSVANNLRRAIAQTKVKP